MSSLDNVDENLLEEQDKVVINDIMQIIADEQNGRLDKTAEQIKAYLDFISEIQSRSTNEEKRKKAYLLHMKLELLYRRKFYGQETDTAAFLRKSGNF